MSAADVPDCPPTCPDCGHCELPGCKLCAAFNYPPTDWERLVRPTVKTSPRATSKRQAHNACCSVNSGQPGARCDCWQAQFGTTSAARAVDPVDHPPHYGGDVPTEPIKVIEAWGLGFSLGNAVKYITRAGKKPGATALDDLEKAKWYLARHIAFVTGGGK